MKKIFILLVFWAFPVMAWDGYDYSNGTYVEIDKGNLVREGEDIEIYDYNAGEYRNVEVQNIDRYGGSTEVEVYDYETGEYRTLKICLILVALLVTTESAWAENFVNTLGAECGRVLFIMENYDYPDMYPAIVKRNTQFDALEKCLSLYKQNGGDIRELNLRYHTATAIAGCALVTCLEKNTSSESSSKDCTNKQQAVFNNVMKMDKCIAYDAYKQDYPSCPAISVLKILCETSQTKEK